MLGAMGSAVSKALLLGGVLLVSALPIACSSADERAEEAQGEAHEALNRGDRRAALEAIETLQRSAADTPDGLMEIATLLIAAGEAPQVLWLLEDGVRRFPEHEPLRFGLARVALSLGNSGAALLALEPIGPDSENHVNALVLRGHAELSRGDLGRGLEFFAEAEERYPEQPAAILARISALMSERRVDEARSALDAARERFAGGEHQDALRQVEVSFYTLEGQLGDTEAAAAGLRALIEARPEDTAAWQAWVQLMWKQRQVEPAIAFLEQAIAEDPERVQLHQVLIPLLTAVGRREDAETLLRQRIERAPSPAAYDALARFHLRLREPERALSLFDEALEAFPDAAILEILRVETLLQLDEVEKARAQVDGYEDRYPDDPNAEYLRARIELADGDAVAAIERLTRAMPEIDTATPQHWLGKALQANGDHEAARRRFGLAIAREPRDASLYVPLIELAEQRGDWRGVASTAARMTSVAPGMFEGWEAAIIGLVNLGDPAAVPAAKRCLALFPDEARAHLLLARAQRSAGDHETALATLAAVRERFGATAEIVADEALTLGMVGRVAEGVAVAQTGLAESPDSPELFAALASLLFSAGQAEQGAQAADRALALAPDAPHPLADRARFFAATGNFEAATRDAERYLARRPDDTSVLFILAVAHQQSGRDADAITAYRRAAELDPRAAAPRNNLALLLADRDLTAALAAGQEAYALDPTNASVLDTLGSLYLRKGLVARATPLLEEAHAGAPQDGEVQLHLALAYRDGGRAGDARRLLEDLQSRGGVPDPLLAQVDDAIRSLP